MENLLARCYSSNKQHPSSSSNPSSSDGKRSKSKLWSCHRSVFFIDRDETHTKPTISFVRMERIENFEEFSSRRIGSPADKSRRPMKPFITDQHLSICATMLSPVLHTPSYPIITRTCQHSHAEGNMIGVNLTVTCTMPAPACDPT